MRPITVILLAVAVIAAGLAALLAKTWLSEQSNEPVAIQMAEVLVAAHEIQAGAAILDGDLRYDKWPESTVNPRLLVRRGADDPAQKVVSGTARRVIAEGEPISLAAIFKQEGAGMMAGMLGPGLRAMSIAITNPTAVSGFINPGDHVDVVMGSDIARDMKDKADLGPIVRFATETVLENVRVLAIDQTIARGRDGAAIQGKTVTVEVTPKQVEILTAATMMGQLSVVLRSLANAPTTEQKAGEQKTGEGEQPTGDSFTPDTEVSRALRSVHEGGNKPKAEHRSTGDGVKINRGGHISSRAN